jgi:hypothetical protein
MSNPTPMFKRTIVLWTSFDPGDLTTDELLHMADTYEDGVYLTEFSTRKVENPEEDEDWNDPEAEDDLIPPGNGIDSCLECGVDLEEPEVQVCDGCASDSC